MDLFIPSSYKPGNKNFPKWCNSQCAKAVNIKNHYFKEWKQLQTQHSRTSFHQITQYLLQNHQKCQKMFCPTHQQQNRFLLGWLLLLLVNSQSCLQKNLPIIFPSTKKTTLILLLQVLHPRKVFLRQSLPPTPT